MHDDLDSVFFELLSGRLDKDVISFCIPKLTNEELKLIECKDEMYLRNYFWTFLKKDADVPKADMAKSESKSKFAFCPCWRFTYSLDLDKKESKILSKSAKRRRILF